MGNRENPSRQTGWPSASRKRADFKGHGSIRRPCLSSPKAASLRPYPLKSALFRQPVFKVARGSPGFPPKIGGCLGGILRLPLQRIPGGHAVEGRNTAWHHSKVSVKWIACGRGLKCGNHSPEVALLDIGQVCDLVGCYDTLDCRTLEGGFQQAYCVR